MSPNYNSTFEKNKNFFLFQVLRKYFSKKLFFSFFFYKKEKKKWKHYFVDGGVDFLPWAKSLISRLQMKLDNFN